MVGNNSEPSDSSFRWVPHLKIVNLTIQNYFPSQKKTHYISQFFIVQKRNGKRKSKGSVRCRQTLCCCIAVGRVCCLIGVCVVWRWRVRQSTCNSALFSLLCFFIFIFALKLSFLFLFFCCVSCEGEREREYIWR